MVLKNFSPHFIFPNLMSPLNRPQKTTPKRPLKCWNLSIGSKVTFMASLEAIQPQKGGIYPFWCHHWIGLEKLAQKDLSNVEICPLVQKLHFWPLWGHTASKKWKIMSWTTLYDHGHGAWQFSAISGEGERMSRNSDLDHIVHLKSIKLGTVLLRSIGT